MNVDANFSTDVHAFNLTSGYVHIRLIAQTSLEVTGAYVEQHVVLPTRVAC